MGRASIICYPVGDDDGGNGHASGSKKHKQSRGKDDASREHPSVVGAMAAGHKREVRHPPLRTTTALVVPPLIAELLDVEG